MPVFGKPTGFVRTLQRPRCRDLTVFWQADAASEGHVDMLARIQKR